MRCNLRYAWKIFAPHGIHYLASMVLCLLFCTTVAAQTGPRRIDGSGGLLPHKPSPTSPSPTGTAQPLPVQPTVKDFRRQGPTGPVKQLGPATLDKNVPKMQAVGALFQQAVKPKDIVRTVTRETCEIKTIFTLGFFRRGKPIKEGKLSERRFDAVNGTNLYTGIEIRPKVRFVSAKGAEADVTLTITTRGGRVIRGRTFEFQRKGTREKVSQIKYEAKTDADIVNELKKWSVYPHHIPDELPNNGSDHETIVATITVKNKDSGETCTDTHSTTIQWTKKDVDTPSEPETKRGRKYTLQVSTVVKPEKVPIYPQPTKPGEPKTYTAYTFPMNLFWKVPNPLRCPCTPHQRYKVVQFARGEVKLNDHKKVYRTPFHIDTTAKQQELARQGKNYDPSFTLFPFDKDLKKGKDHIRPVLCPRGKPAVGHFDAPGVPESLYNRLVGKGGWVTQAFRAFLICHNPAAYGPGVNTADAFLKMGVVAELRYTIYYKFQANNTVPIQVDIKETKYIKHNCKKKKLGDFVKGEYEKGYRNPDTTLK